MKNRKQSNEKQDKKSINKKEEVLTQASLRRKSMVELSKNRKVPIIDDTKEMLGKTSIVFMHSPKSKKQGKSKSAEDNSLENFLNDRTAASIRYMNQMKSQHPSRKNKK